MIGQHCVHIRTLVREQPTELSETEGIDECGNIFPVRNKCCNCTNWPIWQCV